MRFRTGWARAVARLVAAVVLLAGTAGATLALSGPASAASSAPPCVSHKVRACVSIDRQLAWLMDDGKVVYGPAHISSGRPGYRSDHGTFDVDYKDIDHVSSQFHAPMPYSVFYNGGEAFHEGSTSTPSHGCIHLSHKSAKEFYSYLHVGDEVVVRS